MLCPLSEVVEESVVRRLSCAVALCWLGQALAAPQCPVEQERFCLSNSCWCVPQDSPIAQGAKQWAAPKLRDWLLQSREQALSQGVQPMPLAVKAQLVNFFDWDLLERVRYRVGDTGQASVGQILLSNPDIRAVTLVDVIVFQRADEAETDAALWAHELTHVQQYQQLGVDEFAARYVRDANSLEIPAYQRQSKISYALRQAHPSAK